MQLSGPDAAVGAGRDVVDRVDPDRPGDEQPAPRVGAVGVLGVVDEVAGVEVPDVALVVQPGRERVAEDLRRRGLGVLRAPLPVVAARRREPPGPGRDVDAERDDDLRHERRDPVAQQRLVGARAGTGEAAGADVPGQAQQRERGQHVERVPLGPERQAPADPGGQAPRADEQRRPEPPPEVGQPAAYEVVGQPRPEPVPVGGQAGDRGHGEEGDEHVQQGGPRHDEGQPVDGEQQPGQAADQGRAGHPPDEPDQHEHQQRPEHQRGDAPAERVHAEQVLAERDQPLADRRVHDELRRLLHHVDVARRDLVVRVLAPVALVAELQQRVRVLGVVRLVEDQLVGVGEVRQPQDERDRGDHAASRPSRAGGRSASGRAAARPWSAAAPAAGWRRRPRPRGPAGRRARAARTPAPAASPGHCSQRSL